MESRRLAPGAGPISNPLFALPAVFVGGGGATEG